MPRIEGKTNWTFTGQQYNMYQREHDVLFAAIRKGQPVNNGKRMATSTMLGIMGRMACYTGQTITWAGQVRPGRTLPSPGCLEPLSASAKSETEWAVTGVHRR